MSGPYDLNKGYSSVSTGKLVYFVDGHTDLLRSLSQCKSMEKVILSPVASLDWHGKMIPQVGQYSNVFHCALPAVLVHTEKYGVHYENRDGWIMTDKKIQVVIVKLWTLLTLNELHLGFGSVGTSRDWGWFAKQIQVIHVFFYIILTNDITTLKRPSF